MESPPSESTLRRRDVVAGVAGATALSALPGCSASGRNEPEGEPTGAPRPGGPGAAPLGGRMPVVFIPHGGGPWPFVDVGFGGPEADDLAAYLRSVRALPASPPRALLVVSAHWEERVPTVMTSPAPPMLYDYYGFPPASYSIQWPAPGAPEVAARVEALLAAAGFETARDAARGFDHGTFVPLKLAYPEAEVPTLQLSLKTGLDPEEHLAMGRALSPLRDEGVFIVGSGMTFHNLRTFRSAAAAPVAQAFDDWLRAAAIMEPAERDRQLVAWASAPSAHEAHPREEHLLPLMVVAGAAGADRAEIGWRGAFAGKALSAYHFG